MQEKATSEHPEVNLDKILLEDIGQFGRYQMMIILLCSVVGFFGGATINQYVFTMNKVNTRCVISECESANGSSQFLQPWIANAVPINSGNTFDNCHRYNITTTNSTEFCPKTLFDTDSIMDCENYVFEHENTGIYELNIPCDEWRRSWIGSVSVIGMMFCLPITGILADRYGRKTALIINSFNKAWIAAIQYFTSSYTGYIIAEFSLALFGSCGFTSAYIIALEFVGPKYRVVISAFLSTCIALGATAEGLLAWTQPYWRYLILITHLPQLITIIYLWIMPESIRWLMSKGRYEESKIILQKAAEINGKVLSERNIKALSELVYKGEKAKSDAQAPLVVQVFKHKRILLRCVVSPILWISALFVYYGLSISSVGISGNRYVNFSAVAAVDIPGYWISVIFLQKMGRKPLIIGAFWICAICQFAYIFMPNGYYRLSLTVYLIGKCTISAVMTSIYVYTAELFPTKHRTSLFSFSSMMGRLGACVAPLTPALGSVLWVNLPFALFGGMAFLSGLLTMLLPETLGAVLPDTMEQAEDLGKNSPSTLSVFSVLKRLFPKRRCYYLG